MQFKPHKMPFCRSFLYPTFLVVFFVCCTLVECAESKNPAIDPVSEKTVSLLAPGRITVSKGLNQPQEFGIKRLNAPFLVAANNVFVAFAEVEYAETENNANGDILTKYVLAEKDIVAKVIENGGDVWSPQFAIRKEKKAANEKKTTLKSPLAVANGNKIYLFAVNYTAQSASGKALDLVLAVGTVTKGGEDEGKNAEINWVVSRQPTLTPETKDQPWGDIFHDEGVFSFLMENGEIVFVVKTKEYDGGKAAYGIMHMKDAEARNGFLVSYVESIKDCQSFFFSWKKKIIMVRQCDGRSSEVKESGDVGKSWKESECPISRLWHHMRFKGDFKTVKINERPVLLFTQERNKKIYSKKIGIHLWVSDGIRAKNIGLATTDDGNKVSMSGRLLYTGDDLFLIYHDIDRRRGGQNAVMVAHLGKLMKEAMSVLTAWRKTDEAVLKLSGGVVPAGTQCEIPAFTDGLVGFLSGSSKDGKQWKDRYLYADATVTKGEKEANGFKFSGLGAGAVWPVGKAPEDQPYNFAKHGFTLLATVTIDGAAEGRDNSVLGVDAENKRLFGLWCSKEKKWAVRGVDGSEITGTETECQQGRAYQVALILNKEGNVAVYVNWEELKTPKDKEGLKNEQPSPISHFYFGAYGEDESKQTADESHVTVWNVLLYNRPFTEEMMSGLKKSEYIIDQKGDDTGDLRVDTDKSSEQPLNSEDSSVRVGVLLQLGLFVLLQLCLQVQYG